MSQKERILGALEQLGGEPLDGSGFEDELPDDSTVAGEDATIAPAGSSASDPGLPL